MRLIKHIRRWNIWRCYNTNNRWHKLLVLLGLRNSPTLIHTLLPEECEEIAKAFEEGVKKGFSVAFGFRIIQIRGEKNEH